MAILKEKFDNPTTYEKGEETDRQSSYFFEIMGNEISVSFIRVKKDWNMFVMVDGTIEPRDNDGVKNDTYTIFSTIKKILDDFIKNRNPEQIDAIGDNESQAGLMEKAFKLFDDYFSEVKRNNVKVTAIK
mgnify:CR=1 FL=1|jgi:hypothetical protein